ncbi:hypothetical protein SAMN05421578_101279 [Paenibacillus macquariensis]|uniref:Uncharacterized protein n=1 Tax=Paenibacillus macquariensis TaxID=948756 RepID=A0ABY1JKA8_9BACL|nr:hypothetical protein SAMN05421578_101279 [Paenibacillus macquariensis]
MSKDPLGVFEYIESQKLMVHFWDSIQYIHSVFLVCKDTLYSKIQVPIMIDNVSKVLYWLSEYQVDLNAPILRNNSFQTS